MEVVASLSQGRTAASQCGLFTHKSVPVIFGPPCINHRSSKSHLNNNDDENNKSNNNNKEYKNRSHNLSLPFQVRSLK